MTHVSILNAGYTELIAADRPDCFDSIPQAERMQGVVRQTVTATPLP